MPAGRLERGVGRVVVAVARRLESRVGPLLARARIRARLHDRALRAWRATDAPLILCYGNINRSPFAEHVARRRERSSATSAGFHADTGRPCPERTTVRAAAYGVDLTSHRSELVTRGALGVADAVFVFDLDNLARVALGNPRALPRTHLIGGLAEAGPVFIEDPHGRDDEALDDVLDRIATAIQRADRDR